MCGRDNGGSGGRGSRGRGSSGIRGGSGCGCCKAVVLGDDGGINDSRDGNHSSADNSNSIDSDSAMEGHVMFRFPLMVGYAKSMVILHAPLVELRWPICFILANFLPHFLLTFFAVNSTYSLRK